MKMCKHRYKARYDKEYTYPAVEAVKAGSAEIKIRGGVAAYLKKETYIYDICVRCGDVKKRYKEKENG